MKKQFLEELEGIFIDPKSKQTLIFNSSENILQTKDKRIKYSETNGIYDILGDLNNSESAAYDSFAHQFDPWITNSRLYLKLIKKITWGYTDDTIYTKKVLDMIPEDFEGVILDVPVGTGIFTVEKYTKLRKAKIIAIDYSIEMLKIAKKRYEEAGLENVIYLRADVCNLPLKTDSIDLVIVMNGIESFKDKIKSIQEMTNVLKKEGKFIGCTYVRGKKKIKDFFSRISSKRMGLVLEPFYTEEELIQLLKLFFNIKKSYTISTKWVFEAFKI
ncbi:MAG: class I SAM-dependent methyltransferase [Candidatus Heimdallarchaeota archaeon]|nr:class I SAM-dependent methyltransferase [Candidatus Heimdallarchaeota archaeon]